MQSILDYLDYRKFLRDFYEEKKKQNYFYSFRYMAQKVGMDHSLLFKVLAFQSSSSTTGTSNGRTWRDISSNGSFSYTLAIDPAKKMQLQCTYWGGDSDRNFYIQIDELYLALQNSNPGTFIYRYYPISHRLLTNKKNIVVTFKPKSGSAA